MGTLNLQISGAAASRVFAHLASRPEMVAFLRGTIDDGEVIGADDAWLFEDDQLEFDRWHVTLTDEARQQVMTWATGSQVLIEAHSHGDFGAPACLSSTDLDGLAVWVPHLRWRLPGLTYVALVYGADSFDGLVWRDEKGPSAVERLTFDGEGEWVATGRSIRRWTRRQNDA